MYYDITLKGFWGYKKGVLNVIEKGPMEEECREYKLGFGKRYGKLLPKVFLEIESIAARLRKSKPRPEAKKTAYCSCYGPSKRCLFPITCLENWKSTFYRGGV